MPDNLEERANWILNSKRFEKINSRNKEIYISFKWKESNQFNSYWYKLLNRQNEAIKYLRMRLNEDNLMRKLFQMLRKIEANIKNQLEINKIKLCKWKWPKKQKQQKITWYIHNRKIKLLRKSIETIKKIEKEPKFMVEDILGMK